MVSGAQIQLYFYGVWRMMMGQPDGIKMLDVSADGFWNSFTAILVALPALLISWLVFAKHAEATMLLSGTRVQILIRLMIAGVGAWILLAMLAVVAPMAKIGGRFVHYVVATNWSSALFAWMLLPPTLLQILFPGMGDVAAFLCLMLFFGTLILSWRITVTAMAKGPLIGSGVFVGMLIASTCTLFLLQILLGLQA